MPDNPDAKQFQTRRENGELRFFWSLREAMADAKDPEVWKVSYAMPSGERVRLVRSEEGIWVNEPIVLSSPDGQP